MSETKVRKYVKTDLEDIIDICYHTGFMGEDLTGKGKFNDKKLFGYLFCFYYPCYEKDNCYVAVDSEEKIIGYIIGTTNSKKQLQRFILKMSARILYRLLFYTLWWHTESFRTVMHFLRSLFREHDPINLFSEYPAHLHINILPGHQGEGVGRRLLSQFENHMKDLKVPGIHLKTSNYNNKAITFYLKAGYNKYYENANSVWPGVLNYKSIIFTKKL
jgi:ribosomal protein S18 acetylase RimI-like enzyme